GNGSGRPEVQGGAADLLEIPAGRTVGRALGRRLPDEHPMRGVSRRRRRRAGRVLVVVVVVLALGGAGAAAAGVGLSGSASPGRVVSSVPPGTAKVGRVVYAAGPVRVGTLKAAVGDALGPDTALLTFTGTARLVTVELAVSDARLAHRGAAVGLKLPNGKTTTG